MNSRSSAHVNKLCAFLLGVFLPACSLDTSWDKSLALFSVSPSEISVDAGDFTKLAAYQYACVRYWPGTGYGSRVKEIVQNPGVSLAVSFELPLLQAGIEYDFKVFARKNRPPSDNYCPRDTSDSLNGSDWVQVGKLEDFRVPQKSESGFWIQIPFEPYPNPVP